MANERGPERQGSTTWLEPLAAALDTPEPLLVLCRSSATVRAVYRFLAEQAATTGRKGYPGLRITTPAVVLAEAAPRSFVPLEVDPSSTELPGGHPWKAKLDGRPRLTALLWQQMARAHEAALVGLPTTGLSTEIRSLLSAGWGMPDHLEGARRLLDRKRGERCLAVGFPPAPFSAMGAISAVVRALLRHLRAEPIDGGNPAHAAEAPLSAVRVADVAAEARMAVREAAGAESVLVLVASNTTAERVRAALARNGIAVADDQSGSLRSHAVVALARPLLPVFASHGKEPLAAKDLLRVLTDPVLSRSAELPDGSKAHASVKHVREMVTACRHARATVDEWVQLAEQSVKHAEAIAADAEEEYRQSAERRLTSARVLQVQVGLLHAHARGEGRLGDLHACLAGIGLSSPADDRVGHAVLRALRAAGHLAAQPDAYDASLAGTVGSGRVDRGVEVLAYDAYDGRPCDRLLLLDVHDKGLARIPAPNPFLSGEELALLGIPAPIDCVRERLAVVRWAASRAISSLAVVTATDGGGRAVSPPFELNLRFAGDEGVGAYGLGLDLPERRDRLALTEGKGNPSPLAIQVDVEWLRRGAWLQEAARPKPPVERTAALPEHIERDLDRLPEELRPWLGQVGTCPGSQDGLPDGFVASASRCQAFTCCLYRAFCESVLRLKVRDEPEEDLDAREVGTAVHASLAAALADTALLVPGAEVENARKAIAKRLRAALPKQVQQLAATVPGVTSDALGLARDGFVVRWSRHLDRYVENLVGDVAEVEEAERKAAMAELKQDARFVALVDAVGAGLADSQMKTLAKNLFGALCRSTAEVDTFLDGLSGATADLSGKSTRLVEPRLGSPAIKKAAVALHAEARPLLERTGYCRGGDLEVVRAELRFGDPDGEPHAIDLGRKSLPVRGSIDLVVRHRGADGGTGTRYRIIDFKTGKTPASPAEITDSVILPQLALYALALEAIGPLARNHSVPVEVSEVALKYVRGRSVAVPVDQAQRKHWRRVFGAVFAHSRAGVFVTLPHPNGCPLSTAKGAYCDFTEVCRLRPGFRMDADEVDADAETTP
jgi:RecB family exonuclease